MREARPTGHRRRARCSGIRFGSAFFGELNDRFGAGADHFPLDLRSKRDRNAFGGDPTSQTRTGTDFELVIDRDIANYRSGDDRTLRVDVTFPLCAAGYCDLASHLTVSLNAAVKQQSSLGFNISDQARVLSD